MKFTQPISLTLALTPLLLLVILLGINVFYFGDASLDGSNQFILLVGGFLAALVGFYQKVSYEDMMDAVSNNLKSTSGSLLILLMVGALSGSWLISGIIPSMIFYGIKILNPTVFLAASVVISALISVATGSSWTTSATVGIALIGIGNAMGVPVGMTAGAIISGAYFGDKMSPLSDTTNLAPVMAGGELFSHIRYMTYTTIPSIAITLIVFIVLSLGLEVNGTVETASLNAAIEERFFISPILFIVPVLVVVMIVKKTPPLIALLAGTLLGGVVALIFQPSLVASITGANSLNLENGYKGMLTAFTTDVSISTSNEALNDLFNSGGMAGMLGTIWLIVCAMVFGGVMEAIGALNRITQSLLSLAQSTFGLFASTVASCLAINLTASDQYLAIVVPGKMFSKAYKDRGLAPENLSRTLEDSGTVTSALIPWNTCGAYHSSVLGVPVFEYFIFAVFNYVSPFVTLIFAALNIKIKQLRA
ncbi:MAG: Na+/H+ antiporter NhaC [Bacteroidetes bacterium]|jgi:NhaC family Na+:H+ antiporter|nr:MAG: Na+/H+ antiporter NhaC [Bacteroidota bacterium]